MDYTVVILAAGKSTRFSNSENKILHLLSDGKSVLAHTIKIFQEDSDCKQIICVVSQETKEHALSLAKGNEEFTFGGASRCESVNNGLKLVKQDYVLIHDGARCYLSKRDLNKVKEALSNHDGVLLAKKVVDTIKTVEDGYVKSTIDRDSLAAAQTPQAFKSDIIVDAYSKAIQDNYLASDDVGVAEKYSDVRVKIVYSEDNNEKITTLKDIR